MNNSIQKEVAKALLEIQAVGFKPNNPLTFKSGLISPVYIDNRRFPFNPTQWHTVISAFAQLAKNEKITFDCIAGIESAGIPHSAALGFHLQKPSVFTRKAVKDHGTKKMFEGGDVTGKTVLLIEDHVTTGYSSLIGVEALRNEGATVTDCFAITSYGFREAKEAFAKAGVTLHTLTDFSVVLEVAQAEKLLTKEEVEKISQWFKEPNSWAKKHGFEK